ncbi:MAG: hypothetical protein KF824_05110 [Fimbriimonadaceae bacterium]|nr:MAG: hypothetical protein KF824_05110 [Fimbriimonadaceae bacterium]
MSRFDELLAKSKYFYLEYSTNDTVALQAAYVGISAELLVRLLLVSKNELLNSDTRPESQYNYHERNRVKERTRPIGEAWHLVKTFHPELKDNESIWNEIMSCRNEFLHSEYFPAPGSMWEARALKLVSALIEFCGINLEEFYSSDYQRVHDLISELDNNVENIVKKRISECRNSFADLIDLEQLEKVKNGQLKAVARPVRFSKIHVCPSCHNNGRMSGESAEYVGSEVDEDGIITETYLVRASKFHCWVCDLELFSNFEISVADLPGKFNYCETTTVSEKFGDDIYDNYISDLRSDYESYWMND